MKLSSLLLASLVESGRDWSLLDKYKLMRNSDFTTGGLLQPRVSFFNPLSRPSWYLGRSNWLRPLAEFHEISKFSFWSFNCHFWRKNHKNENDGEFRDFHEFSLYMNFAFFSENRQLHENFEESYIGWIR